MVHGAGRVDGVQVRAGQPQHAGRVVPGPLLDQFAAGQQGAQQGIGHPVGVGRRQPGVEEDVRLVPGAGEGGAGRAEDGAARGALRGPVFG
ncbi:hypothetical protein O1L68_21375 [Streptomyces lydicus]|nr:hypothetical protein [Streptomyces lydicus]